MMKTIDRYILKLWLSPFLGFLLVITGILLFGRTVRAIEAFGSNPIDWAILAQMLWSIMPYFLTLTIPFAFFFALLKVVSALQQNSEMDALLAAGFSPLRVIRVMFLVATFFWLFLSWTTMEWMPKGQQTFAVLYQAVKNTTAMPDLAPQQFTESFDGLTIYHSGEDEQGLITNFMLEESGSSIYLSQAAKLERQGHFMILTMFDGVHLEGKGLSQRATYFSSYSTSTDVGDMGIVKPVNLNSNPNLLGFTKLLQALKDKPSVVLQAEFHRRLVLASTVLILLVFALPLSSNVKRSGKSYGWLWGIALLLAIYNIQIGLYKQTMVGEIEWWGMWLGQAVFFFIGIALLMLSLKYGHIKLNFLASKKNNV